MLFKPKKTAAKGAPWPRSPNPKPHLHLHRKGKEHQAKARLIQSSRKRSAERARTHRSARIGMQMRRRNLSRHRILGARADGTGRPGQPLRREWAAHVRTNAARHRLGTVPTGGLDTRASMASSRRLLAGSSQTPTPPASKRAQLSGGPQLSSTGRRTAACRNRCRTPHTARCSGVAIVRIQGRGGVAYLV